MALVQSSSSVSHAVVALAGLAGGGSLPWAYWALQAAQDPHVHEVVSHISSASVGLAQSSVDWYGSHEADLYCASGKHLLVGCCVIFLGLILITTVSFACCCGPLGFFGGRAWQYWISTPTNEQGSFRREWSQAFVAPGVSEADLVDLAAVAKAINVGGEAALRRHALQLGVTTESLNAWVKTWNRALQSPHRQ